LLEKNFGDLSEWGIPAARVPVSSQPEGAPTASWNPNAWQAFFIPLGYTCAHLTIVGSNYGEGFLTYGDYNENLCAAALVDWLNGRLPGYSSPTSLVEVLPPYWATGEVAMGGTSYNGTLPFAAAITGVEGLRTIIPFAPVTSSYEYYRSNGSVYAPGRCQGEDVSDIIGYCFGRGWAVSGGTGSSPVFNTFNSEYFSPPKTMFERFYEHVAEAYEGQDRITGDYSAFWDARNQASFGDDVRKDLGMIMFHGFNDNNVKFKNTALINDMADRYGITAKGIFHQGMHTSPYNLNGLNFIPDLHKWFDYYLFGVENGMPDAFPDYRVQSNVDTTWTKYDTWPMGKYQNFYPTGTGRVGTLAATAQTTSVQLTFKDNFIFGLTRPTQTIPAAPVTDPLYTEMATKFGGHGTQMSTAQESRWRNYMLGAGDVTAGWTNNWTAPASGATYDLTQALDDRLLYLMDISEDMTISGTIQMTAKVAADKNVGYISAFLVDFGSERRYLSTTGNTGTVIAPNGSSVNLVSYNQEASPTPARIIARGSVDVQNPNWDGKLWYESREQNWMANYEFQTTAITPGTFYPYTFEMNVMEYTVLKGHKLVLMIFGSDPEYTIRPFTPTGLTLEIGAETFLSLPLVAPH
ncbi:MAG: hypothetical protein FWF85_10600, partial [Clostridiales bacterium]|nr:hypothetical protein [Clostridiales bacterium]